MTAAAMVSAPAAPGLVRDQLQDALDRLLEEGVGPWESIFTAVCFLGAVIAGIETKGGNGVSVFGSQSSAEDLRQLRGGLEAVEDLLEAATHQLAAIVEGLPTSA